MSLEPRRMSALLRAALLLLWLVAWILYWLSGRNTVVGLALLGLAALASVVIIIVSWFIWGRYSSELADMGIAAP